MIKGIILDYGGTLDTGGDHWSKVIKDGWDKAGIAVDEALFEESYIAGEKELDRVTVILPQHNFSDLLKIKIQLELQYLAQTGNFPPAQIESKAMEVADYCYNVAKEKTKAVQPILASLSEKYPLVLVSNFYGNIDTVLKDFEIDKYFKKVIESAKEGVRKPDTGLLEKGIKALGVDPAEILVIGDSYRNDIEPATKLGCQTLMLKGREWGDNDCKDKIERSETATIDKLEDIFRFLEGS